jgi:hypothetical protein
MSGPRFKVKDFLNLESRQVLLAPALPRFRRLPVVRLQPKNYAQVRARNLYNVGYRRTAAYKGMGLGQMTGPLFVCPTGEKVYYTSDCPGGSPPSMYASPVEQDLAQKQGEIDALFAYTGAGQAPAQPQPVNWTPLLLLGGALLLVATMSGGRR